MSPPIRYIGLEHLPAHGPLLLQPTITPVPASTPPGCYRHHLACPSMWPGSCRTSAVRGQPVCFRPASCHAFCLEKSNPDLPVPVHATMVPGYFHLSTASAGVRQAIERLRATRSRPGSHSRRHGCPRRKPGVTPSRCRPFHPISASNGLPSFRWVSAKGRLPVHPLWLPYSLDLRRSLPMVNSTWPSVNWSWSISARCFLRDTFAEFYVPSLDRNQSTCRGGCRTRRYFVKNNFLRIIVVEQSNCAAARWRGPRIDAQAREDAGDVSLPVRSEIPSSKAISLLRSPRAIAQVLPVLCRSGTWSSVLVLWSRSFCVAHQPCHDFGLEKGSPRAARANGMSSVSRSVSLSRKPFALALNPFTIILVFIEIG